MCTTRTYMGIHNSAVTIINVGPALISRPQTTYLYNLITATLTRTIFLLYPWPRTLTNIIPTVCCPLVCTLLDTAGSVFLRRRPLWPRRSSSRRKRTCPSQQGTGERPTGKSHKSNCRERSDPGNILRINFILDCYNWIWFVTYVLSNRPDMFDKEILVQSPGVHCPPCIVKQSGKGSKDLRS